MSTVTSAATRRPYCSPGRLVRESCEQPLALGRVLDLSAFIRVHLRFALCGPVNGYK